MSEITLLNGKENTILLTLMGFCKSSLVPAQSPQFQFMTNYSHELTEWITPADSYYEVEFYSKIGETYFKDTFV